MTGENGGFIVFQDISWGLRALATDIAHKITHGYNTITSMVTRYAPPSENNTAAYIAAVSSDTGIPADQVLNQDAGTLHALVRAIINHENGDEASALISDQDINQGISMISGSLLQLFNAAGIALQNPGTPGEVALILAGFALLWLAGRR